MNRLPTILLAAAVSLVCCPPPLSAQPAAQSALSTLKVFSQQRGQAEASRVVGMVGFNGRDQPYQWLFLQLDPKVPNLLHEYAFRGGHLEAQRSFRRDPKQDLPTSPIAFSKIAIDSTQAFRLADQAAKSAGLGFDALHYQLRNRDLRGEPVWVLNLIDDTRASVGVLYISAVTGETLRSVWYRPGATTSAGPSQPAISRTAQASPKPARKGLIPKLMAKRRAGAGQQPARSAFAAPPMPPRSTR